MSKYIINEMAFNAIKKKVEETNKKWSSFSVEKKNSIINAAIDKAATKNSVFFYGDTDIPLLFIEEDENGAKIAKVTPPTLPQALRLGKRAWNENGKGMIAFAKNPWMLPFDYADGNEDGRNAADALYKGFNPCKTPKENWESYMTPIREIALREHAMRKDMAEAEENKNFIEVKRLSEEIKILSEERKRLNCLNLPKFLAYSERYGNNAPFNHNGSEEGKIISCLSLRVKDFQKWRDAHLEEAKKLADARIDGWNPKWETPVEEADRKMSAYVNKTRSKESEDNAAVYATLSKDEVFYLNFANILNAMFVARGWGHVLRLDETNCENARHDGWGKLVRACFLPDGKANQDKIRSNKKLWGDYLLKKDGTPNNLFGLFFATYHLVGEGMSPDAYCRVCGVSPIQLKEFVDWKRKNERKKEVAAEVAATFVANRSKWAVKPSASILVDEDDAV